MPDQTRRGKTLVKGHTLVREGQPHSASGRIEWSNRVNGAYYGRGKCSCGALSDVLDTAAARKRWHAEHKAEVSDG